MRQSDAVVSNPHFSIYSSRDKWCLDLHYRETLTRSSWHGFVIGVYDTWTEAVSVCKFKQQGTLEELLNEYWR